VRTSAALVVAAVLLLVAPALHAEPGTAKPPRPVHWGIGVGGFGAVTGPADYGPAAELELYPGGRFGRYGVRAEYRGFDNFDAGMVCVGLTFEAGASRPTLQLALHADVGFTYSDTKPVAAAGVQWQLWLSPPFGISLDSGGYLIIDGTDSRLALASAITVRIAR